MDNRDWKKVAIKTLVGPVTDEHYCPLYAGEHFNRALSVAKQHQARIWEKEPSRDYWIVSYDCPPYALSQIEDYEHWTEV